ncbi:MAG: acetyl ornithine aminotransferase family protein [Chloroflexi bacterium]|nr:acetyl ornithine aminotransferase family protein [Chloroflexota bacterium]MCC6896024.1 acetyl ornithine aminotransferase family protein [Anaerolineae bacterium]
MVMNTTTRPGPRSQTIIERDSAVMSGSITPRYPFVIERGEGARVWDVDGNDYVDFAAGIAVTSTGHSHPKVVEAITEQAKKFIHIAGTDYYYDVQVKIAERLAEIAPFDGPARVFLTNSGTEAVEAAFKLARWYTKRQNIIAFFGAFHGRSMGALSLTASKVVQKDGFLPLIPGVHHVPYNNPYRCMHGREEAACRANCICADYITDVLFKRTLPAESVAAIILEPLQGEGGYVLPDSRFVQQLRDICDKHGILLIADEVQSGIGRTGKWWAIEHHGVQPDMVCSAKGLASGMPLGALITRHEIMSWPPGAHGSTFAGNPISCAAALATLELVESGMMQNAAEQGEYIMECLEEMRSHHPSLKHARIDGKGLMIGAELVLDEQRTPAKKLRDSVEDFGIENGLLILGCGESGLRFAPALMIDRATVNEGLERFERALTQAEQAAGLL